MILSIYTVRDNKVNSYMQPQFFRNRGEFERSVMNALNSSNSNIADYPEDFALFELGTWDDTNCKYALHDTPISLGLAVDYKKG